MYILYICNICDIYIYVCNHSISYVYMILPVLQPLWFLFSVAQAFEADFPKIPWEHRQFAKKNSITCFGVLGKPKKPFFASQEQWFLLLLFFFSHVQVVYSNSDLAKSL